jgi:hypothetical protein
MKYVNIGDIFEIPLSTGKIAYGQYLFRSKFGPVVQIYGLFSNSEKNINEIVNAPKLFPPIIVGLFAAIRDNLWVVIGNVPVAGMKHPIFVSTEWDVKGNATFWYSWDGEKDHKIGKILPEEYRKFEFLIIYPPKMLMERIENGKIPFPFYDLIKNNKFTPLE